MIANFVRCGKCGKEEHYGASMPANPDGCIVARAMRMRCKDVGCAFEIVQGNMELTDVDRLRLGLRADNVIG